MKGTEKNRNWKLGRNTSPISMGLILNVALAVAGWALWGWGFVAVVAGAVIAWRIIKGVLSCLLSLSLLILFAFALIKIMF